VFCPECISTTALVAASVVSTGGGVIAVKLARVTDFFRKFPKLFKSKEKSS